MIGTVKWYDPSRGEGFLQCDEGPDVHVPRSALAEPSPGFLIEGQAVEFEIFAIKSGFRAREVRVIESDDEWPQFRDREPIVRRANKNPSA